MNTSLANRECDHLRSTDTVAPLVEIFQKPDQFIALFGSEHDIDNSVVEQIEKHTKQIALVNAVINKLPLPTMSLREALELGYLSEEELRDFYDVLSEILSSDDYTRLALYLPFEYLPDNSETPATTELTQATETFQAAYLAAINSLLSIHDVRANFVDGDVIEESYRIEDLPRIVKVAHLFPKLVELGLVTKDNVIKILNDYNDPSLEDSLKEAFLTYKGATPAPISLEDSQGNSSSPDNEAHSNVDITEARKSWLTTKRIEEAALQSAQDLAEAILANQLAPHSVEQALSPENNPEDASIVSEGIYLAIESKVNSGDLDSALALWDQFSDILFTLWAEDIDPAKGRLTTVFRRLHRLNIIDETTIRDLGIQLPTLEGPFSKNLTFLAEDIKSLENITSILEHHPQLKEFVYPVVLIGGSRLKGYGGSGSDVDVSVFIKPGTPESSRDEIHEILAHTFASGGSSYEPIEFWLEDAEEALRVKNSLKDDVHAADSYWTHILFGAAWIGNQKVISELQKKVLPLYFQDTASNESESTPRKLYLERIEQDVLQYRLMHKGYRRHYPLRSKPGTTNKFTDGSSMFWDSGYRQLATKLFVSNVFLPKLAKK